MPDPDPMVATPTLPLDQVPPDGDEANVVVAPVHTFAVPVIGLAEVFTVITKVAKQPPLSVYVITAVPPETPETMPLMEPTVAIPVLPLVQMPPVGDDVKAVVEPEHTLVAPVMLPGDVLTDTVCDIPQLPIV